MDALAERVDELLPQLTLEEKASLVIGRDFWTTHPVERLGIPSIWLADGPTGVRKSPDSASVGIGDSVPATCFPTESALAASWNPDLIEEVGRAIGRECQAQGVQILLAPGANLKRSPLGGRNFEYFAEDPVLSGQLAAAYIRGVQSQGVGTSLKHFVANEQETGRMYADSVVDERTLRELYLRSFEIAVTSAQPWTLMAAYNMLNGTYCTENRWLLHDVLCTEWGHQGIVMSDWMAVHDPVAAIAAGLNLQMPGMPAVDTVVEAVRGGRLEEAALDAVVRPLLRVILQADAARQTDTTFDAAAHNDLARRAAGECMVLLKNDGGLLPLQASSVPTLAVIGRFAREPRFQGAGSSQVRPTGVENAYGELARLLQGVSSVQYAPGYSDSLEPEAALITEAQRVAAGADVAVVFVGLPASEESEGVDRTTLALPPAHDALVEAVLAVQPRTVVVLTNGSAVAMPWAAQVPAIIEGWLAGQAGGGAVADILLGAVNPSGKLSETFPMRLEDTPPYQDFPGEPALCLYGERLWTGYRWYDDRRIEPLFPFGHGLSYTTFLYSDVQVERTSWGEGTAFTVRCTIRNGGERAGREVVQLYVHEQNPRVHRPEKELRGFASITLQPGEERQVEFSLSPRDFAFYDGAAGGWVIGVGAFDLSLGASSRDIRLQTAVTVEATGPTAPLTALSPIRAWREHVRGAALIAPYLERMQPLGSPGEGGDAEMMDMFMLDLPVGKLALTGVLTTGELDELLEQANNG